MINLITNTKEDSLQKYSYIAAIFFNSDKPFPLDLIQTSNGSNQFK